MLKNKIKKYIFTCMKGKQLNFDGVQDIRKQPTSVRGDFDVFKELTFDDVCHA